LDLLIENQSSLYNCLLFQLDRNASGLIRSNFLRIFSIDEELVSVTHEYIQNTLDTLVQENQKTAYIFSTNIIYLSRAFLLDYTNPLVQRAIAARNFTNPDVSVDNKNPYRHYQLLQETLKREQVFYFQPNTTIFDGKNVSLDIQTIRERGGKKAWTLKDLPSDIEPDFLKNLFKELEERLRTLPPEKRAEVETYIQNAYLKEDGSKLTLEKLRVNICDKPMIFRLLNLQGLAADDPVKDSTFYLYWIFKAVKDQSNICKKGSFFSPQEVMILNLSASVQNCS